MHEKVLFRWLPPVAHMEADRFFNWFQIASCRSAHSAGLNTIDRTCRTEHNQRHERLFFQFKECRKVLLPAFRE